MAIGKGLSVFDLKGVSNMTEQDVNSIVKWFKNKEALGFTCTVSLQQQDGKPLFQIQFKGLETCYEASANRLAHEVVNIGIRVINELYKKAIDYDSQSKAELAKRYEVEFATNSCFFLNTLLNRGVDTFHGLVFQYSYVFALKFKIDHLQYNQGRWITGQQAIDINALRQVI